MSQVKIIIKHLSPIQTEKYQPSGLRIMRKLGKPHFRYYQFTLGLGCLCLHQRPMLDSIYLAPKSVSFLCWKQIYFSWNTCHFKCVYVLFLRNLTKGNNYHNFLFVSQIAVVRLKSIQQLKEIMHFLGSKIPSVRVELH